MLDFDLQSAKSRAIDKRKKSKYFKVMATETNMGIMDEIERMNWEGNTRRY